MTRCYSVSSLSRLAAGLSLLVATTPAVAHPGHGSIDSSLPLHYLAEPAHATPWMLACTAAVMGLAALRWMRKRAGVSSR